MDSSIKRNVPKEYCACTVNGRRCKEAPVNTYHCEKHRYLSEDMMEEEEIEDITELTAGKTILGWFVKNDTLYVRFEDGSQVCIVYGAIQCTLIYDGAVED